MGRKLWNRIGTSFAVVTHNVLIYLSRPVRCAQATAWHNQSSGASDGSMFRIMTGPAMVE